MNFFNILVCLSVNPSVISGLSLVILGLLIKRPVVGFRILPGGVFLRGCVLGLLIKRPDMGFSILPGGVFLLVLLIDGLVNLTCLDVVDFRTVGSDIFFLLFES